jgi:hypothetical protein
VLHQDQALSTRHFATKVKKRPSKSPFMVQSPRLLRHFGALQCREAPKHLILMNRQVGMVPALPLPLRHAKAGRGQ